MPQLKDAPVLVSGTVIDTNPFANRDSGEFDHRKVTVMVAGDTEPGFVVVKIVGDDGIRINPNTMDTVAWIVRSAPYSVDGNSGMSTRFLREVTPADLDKIAAAIKVPAKQ